uniref:Transposase Tnp1/En/Spm-like domain-containing protein n=1 Tax=Aegilops tauschii subsp. strangulata TaxID=200361 RepID=A0A453S2W8_AEGTS
MEANNTNVPKGVIKDQWITLVNNSMTPKAQGISEKNRNNCAMRKSKHTAGTKSFPRVREQLRLKDPEKKYPHRVVLYMHTHQHKSDKKMNEQVVDLKKRIAANPDLVDTSRGKTAWKGDVLNAVLGADKPGHVHGLGLVPNPNQVFDVSTSRHFQNIHLSSLEDTSNEDLLAVRLKMEKLEKRVENQDAEILELKGKTKNSEGQGSLDQISKSRDVPSIAKTISKRKRIYGDGHSQQLGTVGQQNNVKSKETFLDDREMQPSYKRPAVDRAMSLSSRMKMCNKRRKTLVQIRVLWVRSLHLKMLFVLARQIQNRKARKTFSMTWRCNHQTNVLLRIRTKILLSMMNMCNKRRQTLVQIRLVHSVSFKLLKLLFTMHL